MKHKKKDFEISARFPSGQRGRTVNPLAQPSQVRILLSPPTFAKAAVGRPKDFEISGNSSIG